MFTGTFSAGTIYHNTSPWNTKQYFSFPIGYNPRVTVYLEKDLLNNQKRTIGFSLLSQTRQGWSWVLDKDRNLRLHPIVDNKEIKHIIKITNNDINFTTPCLGVTPTKESSGKTLVTKEYVDATEDTITQITTEIEGNITTIEDNITTINNNIKEVENKITEIENNNTTINTNITGIENKITTIENNNTTINHNITEVENKITGIENKITTIENDNTTIESNITEVENKITEIENKITTIEDDNTNIKNIVSSLTPTLYGQLHKTTSAVFKQPLEGEKPTLSAITCNPFTGQWFLSTTDNGRFLYSNDDGETWYSETINLLSNAIVGFLFDNNNGVTFLTQTHVIWGSIGENKTTFTYNSTTIAHKLGTIHNITYDYSSKQWLIGCVGAVHIIPIDKITTRSYFTIGNSIPLVFLYTGALQSIAQQKSWQVNYNGYYDMCFCMPESYSAENKMPGFWFDYKEYKAECMPHVLTEFTETSMASSMFSPTFFGKCNSGYYNNSDIGYHTIAISGVAPLCQSNPYSVPVTSSSVKFSNDYKAWAIPQLYSDEIIIISNEGYFFRVDKTGTTTYSTTYPTTQPPNIGGESRTYGCSVTSGKTIGLSGSLLIYFN